MGSLSVGVDVGQRRDPSAIAVTETASRVEAGRIVVHHLVRHVERLPLDTPYPEVAQRVRSVVVAAVQRLAAGQRGSVRCLLDVTGAGQPLADLVTATGVRVIGVTFVHGAQRTIHSPTRISVGKEWLTARLAVLLETHRLHLPETDAARTLAQELADFEIRVSASGRDTYGAFGATRHDDLVIAAGLSCLDDGPQPFCPAVGPPRPAPPRYILDDRPTRQNPIGDDRALETQVPPWLRGRGIIRW